MNRAFAVPSAGPASPWWVWGLLAVLAVAVGFPRWPTPVEVEATTGFSTHRALGFVRALAGAPRAVGTEHHDEARDLIAGELRRLGLVVSLQNSVSAARLAGYDRSAHLENVLGLIPGRDPNAAGVLLAAHYDSVPFGPGAGDDASSVAVLLETARVLRQGSPPRRNVWLLFTDAEEMGLLGALAFVQENPAPSRLGVAFNFEARGSRGPALMYQLSADNLDLVRELGASVPYPHTHSLFTLLATLAPNDSDATILDRTGIPVVGLAFMEGLEHYHGATDTPEVLDPGSVAHLGSYAVALSRHFSELERLPTRRNGAVYADVAGRWLLALPAAWTAVAGVLAVLVWGLLSVLGLARERAKGLRAGRHRGRSGLLLGAVVLLGAGLPALSNGMGARWADPDHLVREVQALGCGEVLVVAGLSVLLFRSGIGRAGAQDLWSGCWSLWALVTVLVLVVAPGASLPWVVPLLLATLVEASRVMLETRWGQDRWEAALERLGSWLRVLLAAALVALWVPPIALALRAAPPLLVGVPAALAMGVGATLLVSLCPGELLGGARDAPPANRGAPPDSIRRYRRALLPGVLLGLGALVLGNVAVSPRAAFPPSPTDGAGIQSDEAALRFSAARNRDAHPPSETVVKHLSSTGAQQELMMTLLSPPGARCLRLRQEGGPPLRSLDVNGTPVHEVTRFSPELDAVAYRFLVSDHSPRAWNHEHCGAWGRPILLRMNSAGVGPIRLRLVEELQGSSPGEAAPGPIPSAALRSSVIEIGTPAPAS